MKFWVKVTASIVAALLVTASSSCRSANEVHFEVNGRRCMGVKGDGFTMTTDKNKKTDQFNYVIIPFNIDERYDHIEFNIEVKGGLLFYFNIRVDFEKDDDRNNVGKLLTGMDRYWFDEDRNGPCNKGAPISVRMKIKREGNENLIYDEEKTDICYRGNSRFWMYKEIDKLELYPGIYKVSLSNLRDIHVFQKYKVYFFITNR